MAALVKVPSLLPLNAPKRAIRCALARCTVVDHMNCKLAVITHKHGKLPYRLAPRLQPHFAQTLLRQILPSNPGCVSWKRHTVAIRPARWL
jgi:hypothetical protein